MGAAHARLRRQQNARLVKHSFCLHRCLRRRPGNPRIILGYGCIGSLRGGTGSLEIHPSSGRASGVVNRSGGVGKRSCSIRIGATGTGTSFGPAQPQIIIAPLQISKFPRHCIIRPLRNHRLSARQFPHKPRLRRRRGRCRSLKRRPVGSRLRRRPSAVRRAQPPLVPPNTAKNQRRRRHHGPKPSRQSARPHHQRHHSPSPRPGPPSPLPEAEKSAPMKRAETCRSATVIASPVTTSPSKASTA